MSSAPRRAPALDLGIRMATVALLVGALSSASTAFAETPLPKLPKAKLQALVRGRVLVDSLPVPKGCKANVARAMGIAEGSSDAIVHMLLDVARYDEYMIRILKSQWLRRSARSVFGRIEIDLPWPASDAWVIFELRYKHLGRGVFELRWKMRQGTLARYWAYALIEPWDGRNDKVALTYRVIAEPNCYAPKGMLNRGVRRGAEMFLHRVRIRIKKLRRQGKIPKNLSGRYRR